jgi:WD40 repeat protein
MKKLGRAFLVLAVGSLLGLALVASAAGTTAAQSKVKHLQQPVGALAIDGSNVAYDLNNQARSTATNKVRVWNVRTGQTVTVSGKKTATAGDVGGEGVFQLAIAGSRVAWLVNEGGNLESADYLFTSSVTQPKERQVASALRNGDGGCSGRDPIGCTGAWLGGLVGSGNTIALNRWTTDATGHMGSAGLDTLSGTQTKSIATGTSTVEAVSSDAGREAVLHSDGSVAVYSKSGQVLMTLPPASAKEAALNGKNLVVASETRQLQVYDSRSGSLKKTLPTHGSGLHNLDVQGNIAIYTTGPSVRAVNLSSGKTRAVVTLGKHSEILFARIGSAGVAYAVNGVRVFFGKGTLGFMPMARLKAAVG